MAIAFRAAKLGSGITTDETGMSLAQDDIVIAQYYDETGSGASSVTPATGFTQVAFESNADFSPWISLGVYWARRGAGAIATNWSVAGGGAGQCISLVAYSGCLLSGSPVHVVSAITDGNDGSAECASVTTTVDGCWPIGVLSQSVFSAASSSAWANERVDGATTQGTTIYDDGELTVAGATGIQVITITTGQHWKTVTLALEPEDPPVPPPVVFTAIGAKTITGTTTVSIAHPTGTAADQVLLAGRCGWYSDIALSDEAGWTNTVRQAGGFNGAAIDTHTTEVGVDRKEITGADAGPTVFDQVGGTQAGIVGIMASYTKLAGYTWDFATSAGTDDTHGANRSVTGSSSIALDVGDVVAAVVAVDTDASLTITAPAITASGITFGTTNARAPVSAGSIQGHDGNIYWFDATVTAGAGTAAPVLNFTTATSQCGPVGFVRLRATAPAAAGPAIVPTMQPRLAP